MDVKVDLINTRDRLLAFLDQEMSDSLSYHFWNSGVVIRHNEEYEKIEGCDDGVIMHLKSGKKLKADCLLYANGRTGNTDSLALENIGLKTDSRGQLKSEWHVPNGAAACVCRRGCDRLSEPGIGGLRPGTHCRPGVGKRRSDRASD